MGFVEELIELIKNNEIIYNKKCGGYKNIARKAEILENISKTLNQPVSECMNKWKNVRDRFSKLYKEKKNQPSGSGFNLKPEWEFYESLTFLQDHIQPRKTLTNFASSSTPLKEAIKDSAQSSSFDADININITEYGQSSSCVDTTYYEDFSEEQTETDSAEQFEVPKNKRKKKTSHEEMGDKISRTMTDLQQYLKTKSAAVNNFTQSIDILLTTLTDDNRAKAEAKIMEYVCKCQLENLKNGDVDNVKM